MKRKDLHDLRNKDSKDLVKLVLEKKITLAKTKTEMKVAQEKNIKKARNLRDEIAKISTIIREGELREHSAENIGK